MTVEEQLPNEAPAQYMLAPAPVDDWLKFVDIEIRDLRARHGLWPDVGMYYEGSDQFVSSCGKDNVGQRPCPSSSPIELQYLDQSEREGVPTTPQSLGP